MSNVCKECGHVIENKFKLYPLANHTVEYIKKLDCQSEEDKKYSPSPLFLDTMLDDEWKFWDYLANSKGYEEFYDHLEVYYKVNDDNYVNTLILLDASNTWKAYSMDSIYIPELMEFLETGKDVRVKW